jgi:hypothetical protein
MSLRLRPLEPKLDGDPARGWALAISAVAIRQSLVADGRGSYRPQEV